LALSNAVSAGFVELAVLTFRPEFVFPVEIDFDRFDESNFSIAPSVSCEYQRTTISDTDCGGGLELEWSATTVSGLSEFSARLSRETIGGNDRDSISLQYEREF